MVQQFSECFWRQAFKFTACVCVRGGLFHSSDAARMLNTTAEQGLADFCRLFHTAGSVCAYMCASKKKPRESERIDIQNEFAYVVGVIINMDVWACVYLSCSLFGLQFLPRAKINGITQSQLLLHTYAFKHSCSYRYQRP